MVGPVASCQVCGTRTQFGHHIRHKASGRWERKATKKPRRWRVNVQRKRVFVDGRYKRMSICTGCIRTLDKEA